MAVVARAPVSVPALLRLGRVSNLSTVWTDALGGAVLAGGDWHSWRFGLVLLAMSLFYVGGMYLNDYFDRAIDAVERPERPIPSGIIPARLVITIGLALLCGGFILIAAAGTPAAAALAALLAGAVLAYDFYHKDNPLAPIVMGACRALIYAVTAAVVTGSVPLSVIVAAVAVAAYVAGLTYAARQENLNNIGSLWPLALLAAPMIAAVGSLLRGPTAIAVFLLLVCWTGAAVFLLAKRSAGAVPRAVGRLIAGISLCDAALLASVGATTPALIAIGGFLLAFTSQKFIAGT